MNQPLIDLTTETGCRVRAFEQEVDLMLVLTVDSRRVDVILDARSTEEVRVALNGWREEQDARTPGAREET